MPSFLAVCAVIERGHSILLLERADGLGYCLPGGIVRWGESCRDALKREVLEETGLLVQPMGVLEIDSEGGRDPRFSCVQIAYAVEMYGGKERSSEEGEVAWFDLDHLPLPMGFDHAAVLERFLRANRKEQAC